MMMRNPFVASNTPRCRVFLSTLTAIALATTGRCDFAMANDWPQWQGPDRNAISKEKGLLQQWPTNGPTIAWSTKGLGGGDSAPAIAAGKIFGMSNRGNQEVVWALSESDGKEVWVTPIGAAVEQRVPQSKEGPAGTPAIDGDRLYVIGMGGRVVCLNVSDGKIVWQRSLTEDFGGAIPAWSFRESPLIDGDKLICTPGGADATLVALNKMTGETLWKSVLPAASATPTGGSPDFSNRSGRTNAPGGREAGANNAVTGTKDPGLFASEHYGMRSFSQKLPNGKYLAKLYFAETYERVTEAGQRVFSFTVQGQEFKDFDIWKKAGGLRKAYIESVPVEVTDGEFRVVFTAKVENPAIKAIEIIPQSKDATESATLRIKAGQSTPFTDSNGQVWKADQGFDGGQMSAGTVGFSGGGGAPGQFGGGQFGGGRFGGGRGGFGGIGRSGAAYSSAIAIDFEGQQQYVQLTSTALIGVAASDGKFLWRYNRAANGMGINCSTPIFQDGLIFASSAYGNGGGAVKLSKDASGGVTASEVYFSTTMQNHHGGMIVVDGCLYGANGGNEGGFLTVLDFQTGKVLWRDRQAPKGSLALADGRLYLRSEQGALILIEPSRTGLVERGRFEQPERTNLPAWAHPVIANGKLYIRDQGLLLCYDIKADTK